VGYELLLHAAEAFRVNVILVVGHDRLYSLLTTHHRKKAERELAEEEAMSDPAADPSEDPKARDKKLKARQPKIIKLPRSGGVVSRDAPFRRDCRRQSIRRYFHGEKIRQAEAAPSSGAPSSSEVGSGGGAPPAAERRRYTPFLLELPFSSLRVYELSSVSLSAALLPVSAKQSTDPVQLSETSFHPSMKHAILAVCHPSAVLRYGETGRASDLYSAGVAGFVAVEKVDTDVEAVSLLSPCAGDLPSGVLLTGDIRWME